MCATGYQWRHRSNVILHIYWTNNTVKYMSACVCAFGRLQSCCWLTGGGVWRRRRSRFRPQHLNLCKTRKSTTVLGHGVVFSLYDGCCQIDFCICCVGGCVLSASWRPMGDRLPTALEQSPPTPHRFGSDLDSSARRRWTKTKLQISTTGGTTTL